MNKQTEDAIMNTVAIVIARILYFSGGFFIPIGVLAYLGSRTHISLTEAYDSMSPFFFLCLMVTCCVSAALSAWYGPTLYSKTFHRGRGKLKEVKQASAGKHLEYKNR